MRVRITMMYGSGIIELKETNTKLEDENDLGMNRKFTSRSMNDGFSGGEKKRCEILQMMMLDPKYCILDETDSGLTLTHFELFPQELTNARTKIGEYSLLLITKDYWNILSPIRFMFSGTVKLHALALRSLPLNWKTEGTTG